VVTYYNDPGLTPTTGDFQILVDGAPVAAFAPNAAARRFFDAQYPIPTSATYGHRMVTVKFDGGADGRIAPVFGVRMIRVK
jgi:hypothetical protein